MKYWLLLFIFVFCFCCKENHPYPKVIMPKANKVFMVNSADMIELSNYNHLAGNIDEDFQISFVKKSEQMEKEKSVRLINLDTLLPRYNVRIVVDTSYTVYTSGFDYRRSLAERKLNNGLLHGRGVKSNQRDLSKKEVSRLIDESMKIISTKILCYPLLILNKNKDSILTKFKFIQEAKNSQGQWQPIECYYNFGGCGNPEMYFYKLASEKYLIYPIIKYHGNYKTKMRVKVFNRGKVYYSNEFFGYINQSQFDINVFRKEFENRYPDYNFEESSKVFFLDEL